MLPWRACAGALTALTVAVVAALAAGPTTPAPTAPATTATLADDAIEGHQLGVDAAGGAVVAWVRGLTDEVFASVRPAGGRFAPGLRLSAIRGSRVDSGEPDDIRGDLGLAVGAGGDAAVVWRTGNHPGVIVVRKPPAGAFKEAVALPGQASDHFPVAAIDGRGLLAVAWLRSARKGCGSIVMVSVAARDAPFSAPRRASGACPKATALRVALARGGSGVVAWQSSRGDASIQAATFVHGTFAAAREVSRHTVVTLAGFATNTLALAAGRDESIVAWRDKATAGGRGRAMSAVINGRQIRPPVALSTSDRIAGPVHAAMNVADTAIVTWGELAGGRSATRRAARAFSAPEPTPCRGPAEIALDARGGALAGFWWACRALYAAARRPVNRAWQKPLSLETHEDEDGLITFGKSVKVGLSDAGEGVVEWKDDRGLHARIVPAP